MENGKKTIVVFGCTGTVGHHVLRRLAQADCQVRGVLRHPGRPQPLAAAGRGNLAYVSADLADPKAVSAACAFADALFLLTATHPDQVAYEANVIRAAQRQGVRRVVRLSAPAVTPPGLVQVSQWHRAIEERLAASGIAHCNLRPRAFMQNWARNTFTIQKFGKFYGAMQSAPRNYVDARDVAEVACQLLLQDQPLAQRAIAIAGPEAISHYEMAERLSTVAGRKIQYVDLPADALMAKLQKSAKLPHWLAKHLVELDLLAVKVPEKPAADTERLLGKKPRLMAEYLHQAKDVFAKKPLWKFWGK